MLKKKKLKKNLKNGEMQKLVLNKQWDGQINLKERRVEQEDAAAEIAALVKIEMSGCRIACKNVRYQ